MVNVSFPDKSQLRKTIFYKLDTNITIWATIITIRKIEKVWLSSVTDFVHKMLPPSTYECQLCALTYGSFFMKQEWKSFVESLPIKTVFLLKNEFEKQYKIQTALSAVYVATNATIKEMITKQEIIAVRI